MCCLIKSFSGRGSLWTFPGGFQTVHFFLRFFFGYTLKPLQILNEQPAMKSHQVCLFEGGSVENTGIYSFCLISRKYYVCTRVRIVFRLVAVDCFFFLSRGCQTNVSSYFEACILLDPWLGFHYVHWAGGSLLNLKHFSKFKIFLQFSDLATIWGGCIATHWKISSLRSYCCRWFIGDSGDLGNKTLMSKVYLMLND